MNNIIQTALIKYNSPSINPNSLTRNNISINSTYEVSEILKYIPLDLLKLLFIPINGKWEDYEEKEIKQETIEEIKPISKFIKQKNTKTK